MQTSVKSLAIVTDVHRGLLHSKITYIRLRSIPSTSFSIHYSLEFDAIVTDALAEISAIKSLSCSVRLL
jgi:hypothetical protein